MGPALGASGRGRASGARPFSGAVLAGGASSRFGEPKALFDYRGKPLIGWVLDSLEEASERFVVADRQLPGVAVPVVGDLVPGFDSLSGLHSALSHARYDWVAVAACDLPFLTPAYWRVLLAATEGVELVVATDAEGRLEPLAALYHRSLRDLVGDQLARRDLAPKRLAERAASRILSWRELPPDLGDRLFVNANRRSDLP